MISLPPPDHIAHRSETAYCVVSASHRFKLPVDGLLSILLVENGKVGGQKVNENGTYDLGPMQINTVWLGQKSPLYGFVSAEKLKDDLCTNIHSAAWILASQQRVVKDIWTAVGRYHSPGNQEYAAAYKRRVNDKLGQAHAVMANVPYYGQYIQTFYGATKEGQNW